MSEISEKAVGFWNSGYLCAESVLLAVAQNQGIESELVPKIASGFCSGFARTGGTCGALCGAVMALSLVYGWDGKDFDRSRLYEKVQTLETEFKSEFGSTNCSELLQLDLGTAEGQAGYKAGNLSRRCAGFIGSAAELVAGLLD